MSVCQSVPVRLSRRIYSTLRVTHQAAAPTQPAYVSSLLRKVRYTCLVFVLKTLTRGSTDHLSNSFAILRTADDTSLAIADDLPRCDWLGKGRNVLIITGAVRHLAIAILEMIGFDAFRAVWLASNVSRYLSILCLCSRTSTLGDGLTGKHRAVRASRVRRAVKTVTAYRERKCAENYNKWHSNFFS